MLGRTFIFILTAHIIGCFRVTLVAYYLVHSQFMIYVTFVTVARARLRVWIDALRVGVMIKGYPTHRAVKDCFGVLVAIFPLRAQLELG